MAAPVLIDHLAVVDRYAVAGGVSLDLYEVMIPEGLPTPASCTVTFTSGTSGHWSKTGGVLTPSSAGDTADLSSGTYVATCDFVFAPYAAPDNAATAYLTILCPADSKYVDPAGSDSAAGTKAAPWAHSPDDPNATGNALAHVASVMTAIVHKDGSLIRSAIKPKSANRWNIGGQGWGSGGKARYTGADALGAGAAASSGEVFGNPNVANIKKWTVPAGKKKSQWLIDRNAPTDAQGLVMWAQWPAAGVDPYIQSFGIQRGAVDGMYRVNPSTFVVNGATSTWTVPTELLALFNAEFGSADLTGAYIAFPSTEGSFVGWFAITGWDGANKRATFNIGSSIVKAASDGLTAVQIVGHPRSIKAAGQFGHLVGSTNVFSWPVDGTAVELMTRLQGCDTTQVLDGGIYGLAFDGYYGDTSDVEGSVVCGGHSADYKFAMLECDVRWLVSHEGSGGMYRHITTTGSVLNDGSIVQGNTCNYTIGSAMVRMGSAANGRFRRNSGIKFSATSFYIGGIKATTIVEFNKLVDGFGPHSNGFVFYVNPERALVRGNVTVNVVRPLAAQDDTTVAYPGLDFRFNRWGRDRLIEDGARIYGPRHTFYRDMFVRDAQAPANTDRYSVSISAGAACTFTDCIIDGMIGGTDATFIDCLKVGESWYDPVQIEDNVAPNSGNAYEPYAWDGVNVPARWKQILGTGSQGLDYLYGIAVIPGLTNITGADVSTWTETPWLGPVTADYVPTPTLTNCEMRSNSSASDSGATAYSATPGAVALNGKYVRFRVMTTSAYDTINSASADLGNSNVYAWTVKTKQAAGYPLINVDTSDWWGYAAAGALGAADTKTLTLGFFGNIASMGTDVFIGGYQGGTSYGVYIETLGSNKLRVNLLNGSRATIATFSTAAFTSALGANMMLLLTVDMAQANPAAGVKFYVNGVSLGLDGGATTWVQNGDIDWNYNASGAVGFLSAVVGKVGMCFLDRGWVDITDANIRDKFAAHRIGNNGAENIMGRQADNFLCGVVADWMTASPGFNRGSATKFLAKSGTAITLDSGGAQGYPTFIPATALVGLTGPDGQVGVARTYSVSTNNSLPDPLVVALSDGGKGGTFSPAALTFNPNTTAETQSFTYTPAQTGAIVLTAARSSGPAVTSATLGITSVPSEATAYSLTGPGTVAVNATADLVVTLNGGNTLGKTIDFALSGVSGVFSQNPLVVPAGETTATVHFTPSTSGTATITPDNVEGMTDPAPLVVTVTGSAPPVGAKNAAGLRLGLGLSL